MTYNYNYQDENGNFAPKDIKELLKLTRSNNKMLKEIIRYINYINAHANTENDNDFTRNVIANLISNCIPGFKR